MTSLRIKPNETKSTYINFTNQRIDQRWLIFLYGAKILSVWTTKCLGKVLDDNFRWKAQITKNKIPKIYNKALLYIQVQRQVPNYSKNCNDDIVQRLQNKVLTFLVNALWSASNSAIHWDFGIKTTPSIIMRHESRLQHRISQTDQSFRVSKAFRQLGDPMVKLSMPN